MAGWAFQGWHMAGWTFAGYHLAGTDVIAATSTTLYTAAAEVYADGFKAGLIR